jgi:hypothetical protein
MDAQAIPAPPRSRAVLALALLMPGLLFVVMNILKFELGVDQPYDALEPAFVPEGAVLATIVNGIILLGPVAAALLTVLPMLRARLHRDGGILRLELALRLNPLHLVVAVLALAIVGTLGAYLIAENLPCLLGSETRC